MWGKGPSRGALGGPCLLAVAMGHSRRDPAKRLSRVLESGEETGSPFSLLQPQFKRLSLPLFLHSNANGPVPGGCDCQGCVPHRVFLARVHSTTEVRRGSLEMGRPSKLLSRSRRCLQAQSTLRFSFKSKLFHIEASIQSIFPSL